MITVSNAFRERMQYNTRFLPHAVITLANGTVLEPGMADFALGNNSLADGAGANSFPIGAAVERIAKIELVNLEGQYSDVSFLGAKVRLFLSFDLDDEGVDTENIEFGTFTVTEPESYGETVILTAADDMYRADQPFRTTLTFPATAGALFADICRLTGIEQGSQSFSNSGFTIDHAPSSDLTFRQVIGYIAMIAGGNARVNRLGRLEVISYDFDYTGALHSLDAFKSLRTGLDDIVITGVKTVKEDKTEVLQGQEGYVLSLSNPLIAGHEETAMLLIGNILIGGTFRNFTADHIAYPLAEFMDKVELTDWKGQVLHSVLTDVDFTFGSFTILKNSATPPTRNSSTYSSAAAQAILKAQELITKERTQREAAIANLATALSHSNGMYQTTESAAGGGTIYYLHDKPTLAESQTVLKLNADALGISTDGGQTYPFGLDFTGEAILRKLYVEGIDANYIRIHNQSLVEEIQELQDQVDGALETWSGSAEPTLSNEPAVNWTTDAIKNQHIGDVYYRTDAQGTSYAYRFILSDGTYSWMLIRDTEVTQALADAKEALEAAQAAQGDVDDLSTFVNGSIYTKTSVDSLFEAQESSLKSYMSQQYVTAGTYNSDKEGIQGSISAVSQNVSSLEQDLSGFKTQVSQTYATQSSLNTAKSDAAADAKSKADKALQDAKADTDEKLQSYSTTSEMNSAISQKADEITLSVSQTYATQTSVNEAKNQTITGDTLHYLATDKSSGVTTSTSGWSTSAQSVTAAKRYLWIYHTYTYGSGTTKDTAPVISGVYGNTGDPGTPGDTGVGISSVAEKYAVNNSSSSAPADSAFKDAVQTPTASNRYLWNYEIITYTNNTTSTTEKRIIGVYGQSGEDGRGISAVTNYYLATSESSGVTTETTGWTTAMQSVSTSKKYLWNYEKITYTSGEPTTTTPGIIGAYGDTGSAAVSYTLILSDSAIVRSAAGVVSPTKIKLTAKSQSGANALANYAGRFLIETTTDGSTWTIAYTSSSNQSSYTYTVPTDVKAIRCGLYLAGGTTTLLDQQTVPVIQEAKSITAVTEYYALNNSTTAPAASSFTTGVKTPTASNRYLWNMEKITYSDGQTESKDIHIVAMYSEDGAPGTDGRGISSITEYYALSTTTTAPADSSFGTTVKTVDATNKYLWNYEKVTYTSGDTETTGKRIIGVYGDGAYTVVLTNESHTFSAGVSAAIASSAECQVIAYKGVTQVAAKIGTISGAPTGMSTAISDNNTTSAKFTVSVTTSLTTKQGVLTVPITVDGKSFIRNFSWSLALTGGKGDKGDDGISIVEVVPLYKAYNSETAPAAPTSAVTSTSTGTNVWTKAIPKLTSTYCYLFTCDQIKYSNNTYTWTTVVADINTASFYERITAAELKVTDDAIASTVASKYVNQLAYLRDSSTGLGVKVNHTTLTTSNNGEIYFHGFDDSLADAAVDGWVWWNGEKVTIEAGMWVNPNTSAPYNTVIYHVFRTSDSKHYDVWYDENNTAWRGYSYTADTTSHQPETISAFTWNETTDIVLLSYISPGSEAAIVGTVLFTPPKKASEITQLSSAISQIDQRERSILLTVRETYTSKDDVPVNNMLPSVYRTEEAQGRVYVSHGITWTVNSDGSVTATGTADADSTYNFTGNRPYNPVPAIKIDPTQKYSISGCPAGGSTSTYYTRATFMTEECYQSDATAGTYKSCNADVGSGSTMSETGWDYARMWATIKSGTVCPEGGLVFKPMFEKGTIKHGYVSTHGAYSVFDRIVSSETAISQNANDIGLVVTDHLLDGNKVVGAINLTSTTALINAENIDLTGAVTISSLDQNAKGALVTNVTTKNQYYLSTSKSSATGGSWQDTVPAWSSGKYVWTRVQVTKTLASGTTSTNTSTAIYDTNLTEALSSAAAANSAAANAQSAADAAQDSADAAQSSVDALEARTQVVNLLPSIYYSEQQNGTTRTHYGVKWTLNPDGSVTAAGTATGDSLYYLNTNGMTSSPPLITLDDTKKYTISGCPAGGSTSTYGIQGFFYNEVGGTYNIAWDVGSGRTITNTYKYVYLRLVVKSGYAIPEGGLTFYPMLEVGSTKHSYVSSHNGASALSSTSIKATVSVYYRSESSTTPTIDTSSPIGTALDTDDHWEYPMPRPKNGRYFYTCERYTYADGSIGFSTVRKMDYLNYVSMWSSAENATYMDGGHIAANSITANKIQSKSLTADQIQSGSITADELNITNLAALNATVGGFGIKEDWLQYGTWGTDGGFMICPRGTTTTKTIGGHSGKDWALTIGDKFGVTTDGSGYVSAGEIKMETSSTTMDMIKLNYKNSEGKTSYTAMSSGYVQTYDETSGIYSKMFNNGYTTYGGSNTLHVQLGVYNMGDDGIRGALVFPHGDGEIAQVSLLRASNGAMFHNITGLELYPASTSAGHGGLVDFHYNRSSADYSGRLMGTSTGVAAYQSITNASDRRLKEYKGKIDSRFIALLEMLNPIEYEYKQFPEARHFGMFAQDVKEACESLGIDHSGLIGMAALKAPDDKTEYYTLDYTDLVAVLIAGWQEHEKTIKWLREQLERSNDDGN